MNNDQLTKLVMSLADLPDSHVAEGVINLVLAAFKQALPSARAEEVGGDLHGDIGTIWRSAQLPHGAISVLPYEAPKRQIDTMKLYAITQEVGVYLTNAKIPYAVGGGLALEAYGVRKTTADIDFFVRREDADDALLALRAFGYHTQHTSEGWIYKAFRGMQVVDFIFASSTGLAIDDEILGRARFGSARGFSFLVLSPEDLMLFKIPLVVNPERRDWDDLLALLPRVGEVEWGYIVRREAVPAPLLLAFLLVLQARHPGFVPEALLEDLRARLSYADLPAASPASL